MLCILFIPSVIFNVLYKRVQGAEIKVLAAPVFGNFKPRTEKLWFFHLVGILVVGQDGYYDGWSWGLWWWVT